MAHEAAFQQDGRVVGTFEASGVRPLFAERLKVSGVELPMAMFEEL